MNEWKQIIFINKLKWSSINIIVIDQRRGIIYIAIYYNWNLKAF